MRPFFKVFLHTYWVAWGEVEAPEGRKLPRRISRGWMKHIFPPYYACDWGMSIRFKRRALRFGTCHPQLVLDPKWPATLSEEMTAAGATGVDGTEQEQWGYSGKLPACRTEKVPMILDDQKQSELIANFRAEYEANRALTMGPRATPI